jgi:hypothetical protein
LAGKTKQGATSSVSFSWKISTIKQMFTNNALSYRMIKNILLNSHW